MRHSENVESQILEWYSSGYFNSADMIKHLQSDKIDNFEHSAESHIGFDLSYDKSLCVFYYEDDSVLIVSSCGLNAK